MRRTLGDGDCRSTWSRRSGSSPPRSGPAPTEMPTRNGRSGRGMTSSCNISGRPQGRSAEPCRCARCCGVSGSTCRTPRAGQLEQHRGVHPVVEALLTWRKAERIATTYGYRWLDEHVTDGRLRGAWTSSDGAAGRMTASVGLHNLPADLRPAVAAEAGSRVRAGRPRPDRAAGAGGGVGRRGAGRGDPDDDLYRPVATGCSVDRATAKVAVLAAMYGATTGHVGAGVARSRARLSDRRWRSWRRPPLPDGRARTCTRYGGRRVRMWVDAVGRGRHGPRPRGAARAIRAQRADRRAPPPSSSRCGR